MPGEDINTTLRFDADISEFSAAMQEANRAASLAKSKFNAVSSEMDDWSNSTDGLTAKLEQLDAQHQVEKRRLEILQAAYEKTVEEQGFYSKAAVELRTKLNNQKAAVNKAAKEHQKFSKRLEEVGENADDAADEVKKAGDAAKKAGDAAEDAGDGWTIFKDVIADFVSNAISGLVDSITSAAEATREYRRDMAQMAQNAADAGADMDVMKETLADVASITGEADAAMEGLNMLMASGLDTNGIVLASEALSGAATKFDGVKFEGIAEGLQETLAVGEAVGPFAEIVERTGGNLETFNAGLAACTTEAERQQYVLQWLADSGLAGVHDAYVQNNADLVAAEQAQFRLNDAMASVGAAVEPIQTALTNVGATILESVAPIIMDIVQWTLDNLPAIEPYITGIATALGVLAAALAIQGLINGVQKAFALLNATLLANPVVLIVALIAGLVAAFVRLWNKSEAFRNFWITMWEGIKTAFSATVEFLGTAATNIATFFSDAWEAIKGVWKESTIGKYFNQIWNTVKGIFAVVKAVLSGNFSDAWEAIKGIFSGWAAFWSGLWNKISSVFSVVGSWFGNAFRGAWRNITSAFANVKSFFSGVWSNIKSAFSFGDMLDIGKNIVQGLWNGINGNVGWIKSKIKSWVGDVMSFLKNLFGINSPSTVMRDEVGKMLGFGMVEGIEKSRAAVNDAMRGLNAAAMDGFSSVGGVANVGGVGGKTIILNQTNNSPRALSRREIYRQTHNALAYAGGK